MLNNFDKKSPFKVPENYFQNFNQDIMNQLPTQEKRKKVVPLWMQISRWSAVAAVVAGLAVLGNNYLNKDTDIESLLYSNNQTSAEAYSIDTEYYQFIEDESTEIAYRDAMYDVEY